MPALNAIFTCVRVYGFIHVCMISYMCGFHLLEASSLTRGFFRNVLFNFQIFRDFPGIDFSFNFIMVRECPFTIDSLSFSRPAYGLTQ